MYLPQDSRRCRKGLEAGKGHAMRQGSVEDSGLGEDAQDADVHSRAETIRVLMRSLWDWTRIAAVAVLLFSGVRVFVVEAFKIPTSSMEGTLLVGDFVLVNKAVYGAHVPGTDLQLPTLAEPGRGDVIVFTPPHEPEKNYVKRVVGVGGDTLSMVAKVLYVNGRAVEERYARHIDRSGSDAIHPKMRWQDNHLIASPLTRDRHRRASRDNWGPLVVPEGEFFVLGDNRDNSEDSRYWGFVSRDSVTGRPWFVYLSFRRLDTSPREWLRSVRWKRIGQRID